jgi:hypothetical protein
MTKSIQLTFVAIVLIATNSFGQQEKGIVGSSNWLNNWTDFKPVKTESNETNSILVGNISTNTTLTKNNTYLLQGNVYVINNSVLTIEAGTVIKGDFETTGTLVITKGSSINAQGKDTDPIVFTSNKSPKKAGDWGGIVIFGEAQVNKFGGVASLNLELEPTRNIYGGTNSQSNSGTLQFVRIEFAGKRAKGFDYCNALTLCGVGSKTTISNVMCSFSGNDSFAVFGGEVKANKLISLKANDDDFEITQGAQFVLDNSIAIRNSYISSPKYFPRCLELNAYVKKEDTDFSKKPTSIVASNVIFLNDSRELAAEIGMGLVKESIYVSEGTLLSFRKSVLNGFKPAVILDKNIETKPENFKKIKFEEMFFNNCTGNVFAENEANNEDIEDYYGQLSLSNVFDQKSNEDIYLDFKNPKTPDYRIQLSKITASTK